MSLIIYSVTEKLQQKQQSVTENLQPKQTWAVKSSNLRENAGNVRSVFLEHPCKLKKSERCLEYCGSWKIPSENLRLRSTYIGTLGAIRNEFWMKGALVTVEICVLCGWRLSNQFDSVSEILTSCYSWPRAVVNYTLLTAVPWNELEHSRRKARLCVYFNWF